jgi:hypothetical protein
VISTKSSFFYIDPITLDNFYLNFSEGAGPELTAEVQIKSYTHSELAAAVATALNNTGALTYTVTLDRQSRVFEISATGVFNLLTQTGINNGADVFPVLGFTGPDKVGQSSYVGNIEAGLEYLPQFWLQDYVDAEDNQQSIMPVVVKTSLGEVEVVKFGDENFFEFEIMFATDIVQGKGSVIETNPSGVADLRSFMRFCVTKNRVEFMPDRDNKAAFEKVLLESTEASSDGTGFKLKEMYRDGLVGYFSSGPLKFRVT